MMCLIKFADKGNQHYYNNAHKLINKEKSNPAIRVYCHFWSYSYSTFSNNCFPRTKF